MIIAIFASILLLAVFLLMFLNPELFWKITESWKSYGGEPSDWYIKETKIAGAVLSIVFFSFIIFLIIDSIL